jgi:hypothetical protein
LAQLLFFTGISTLPRPGHGQFYIIGNAMRDRGRQRHRRDGEYRRRALGVVLGFMWGVLLLHLDLSHTDLPALALTIVITTFSTSGLGLLMGCLSLITLNVMFINNAVYFALLLFSGANVPVASLPPWMQAISEVLPLTHGIRAARLLIAGADLQQVAPLLLTEFLIGVVYVLIGYVMFRWFELQAKKRGTLKQCDQQRRVQDSPYNSFIHAVRLATCRPGSPSHCASARRCRPPV